MMGAWWLFLLFVLLVDLCNAQKRALFDVAHSVSSRGAIKGVSTLIFGTMKTSVFITNPIKVCVSVFDSDLGPSLLGPT